jgi:hypothetical protein
MSSDMNCVRFSRLTFCATISLTFPSEVRDPLTPAQGRIKKPIDVDLFVSYR